MTTLGDGGPVVSRVGLGLAALGRPGYITVGHVDDLAGDLAEPAMRERAHAVLDVAWRAGVRYFDAARSYGRAEDFLGTWLASRRHPPADAVVGSKWGYTYTAGWRVDAAVHEVKEHSLAVLRRQYGETLARLGRPPHLYQIHSATVESGVLDDGAVLDELARLRAAGVRIGLSTSGPRQAETIGRALAVRRDGARLFDVVQATWNLLERSAEGALADARACGVGVIVKEALANGRLTARNREPGLAAALRALAGEAARAGCDVDALAIAAALARPWADVVLSGAATPEQLASNVRAVDVAWSGALAERLAGLAMAPEAYWRLRSALPWN
jgi:aryl-alcohol dehydrogenase-like predicted oxidoreductase